MAKAASYKSIFETISSEAEPPKQIPYGSYVCTLIGVPVIDKSTGEKATDYVDFNLRLDEALKDVDKDELEESGAIGRNIRYRVWVSEKSKYRLRDFLDHCEAGDDDMTLGERVQETPGKQVIANIRAGRPRPDGRVFAEVVSTAPVD